MSLTLPTVGGDGGVWATKLNNALKALNAGMYVITDPKYGADPTGTADSTAAVQAAFDACAAGGGGLVYAPPGVYKITSTVTLTAKASNQSGRSGGVTFAGANMYQTVFLSSVAGYTFSASADALHVQDLCVKTTTAGGFNLSQGGNVTFHRFFMDGCGASYFGITANTPYPFTVDGCRFWNLNTDYQGGAISVSGGICVNIRSTFISMMQLNGNIVVISNCYDVAIQSIQLESRALTAGANTAQAYISLQGTNQNGYIDGIYTEGQWNKIIDVVGGTSARGFRIGSIYAFNRDDNTNGDPNCLIIDTPSTALSTRLPVDSITFVGQSASAGGNLIDDPNNCVDVRTFRNASTGNQASRSLKQRASTAIAARAYASTTQSVTSGSTVVLTFDSNSFDQLGFHSTSTNTTRFTVPSTYGGTYEIKAQCELHGTGGNRRVLSIRKNGSQLSRTESAAPTSASTLLVLQVTDTVDLADGDVVEIGVFQDSGSGLTTTAGEYATWASVSRLG